MGNPYCSLFSCTSHVFSTGQVIGPEQSDCILSCPYGSKEAKDSRQLENVKILQKPAFYRTGVGWGLPSNENTRVPGATPGAIWSTVDGVVYSSQQQGSTPRCWSAGDLVGPEFNSNYYKYDLRKVNYQSQKSNLNANISPHKAPKDDCESFLDIYTTHLNTVLPVSVVVYRGQCRKKQAVRIQLISTKLVTEKKQACSLSIHTLSDEGILQT